MKSDIIRRLILLLLPLTISSGAIAQNDYQKIFDDFQKSNQEEFQNFRDRANAEYSQFLRQAWVEVNGHKPIQQPDIDPFVPTEVLSSNIKVEDKEIRCNDSVVEQELLKAPEPLAPIHEVSLPFFSKVSFSRYGTSCTVRYNEDRKPVLKGVDENSVADFWDALSSSSDVNNLLYDFFKFRKNRSLCDWAFYKFTEAFSEQLYQEDWNSAVLMHAYILTQSGFKLRLGLGSDKNLHVIIASDCTVYNYLFWELGGSRYYLFDGADISTLKLCKVDFTSSSSIRLLQTSENLFEYQMTASRSFSSKIHDAASVNVSVNKNLIAFYKDYPASSFADESPVSQWLMYANAPLSKNVRDSLYPQLSTIVSGKSELAATELLLNFVQTAFVYRQDEDVWGRDRSFFAEESLYYPYSDCEDRSILFSHLVRDLLGLEVALVYAPGHLFTAVCFPENVKGSHIMIGGRKFIICDPTVINGAPVGFCAVNTNVADFKVGLIKKVDYDNIIVP